MGSDSSEERERQETEEVFEKFVLLRCQHFMSKMSEHVNLAKVIKFLEQRGHGLKYEDFRKTFEDKIETETYFVTILETAKTLIHKELLTHSDDL